MKSDKRKKLFNTKRIAKANRIGNAGHKSNYAKKQEFLRCHGGYGIDYRNKPWK